MLEITLICIIVIMVSPESSSEAFSIVVISPKKESFDIIVRPNNTILELKERIYTNLGFSAPRLILNNAPLKDSLSISDAKLSAGIEVRTAL